MADLRAKPFYLNDEDLRWVRQTIEGMSLEEKIGQLFFNMGASRDEDYLKMTVQKYHIGGVRYNPGKALDIRRQNQILQENAKIPLLIACNTESGGNGACLDGTFLGDCVKIGACQDEQYAYRMSEISNREAAAVGCNLSFAPLSDINYNWRNPIISKRSYGNTPELVCKMSQAYFKGAHTPHDFSEIRFACAAKHFPGDGLDERDQHLSNSVNSFSCEEWTETYGKVYRELIDLGLEAIMAGHIMQPAWSKKLNPSLRDEDIMPATLSPELLGGLLRGELGFNGMILTDASHMVGLTCMMKRSEVLPHAVAAGCDMFLFFNDMDEDFGYMLDGYKNGIITEARLHEALERILALKAKMGLHRLPKDKLVPDEETAKRIVACKEHQQLRAEIARKAITLVKNKQDVLPLSPERHKRILIVPVHAAAGGGVFALMNKGEKVGSAERFADRLRRRGFEVTMYESPLEKINREFEEKRRRAEREGKSLDDSAEKTLMAYFAGKTPIRDFVEAQDLIITFSEVKGTGKTCERVSWAMSKGGGEIPWYVHELPVLVISVAHPFLLADVPQAKTYINAYDAADETLDALVEKLLGEAEFEGKDPVDSFCGLWDTRN